MSATIPEKVSVSPAINRGIAGSPNIFKSTQHDQRGPETSAKLDGEGRVDITIDERNAQLAAFVNLALGDPEAIETQSCDGVSTPNRQSMPRLVLNIVIQVVGSRGDVQPFVALGKVLKDEYGHRIRIATHSVFKCFVEENGLEFFNIGGDPADLMAFMVKHPSLLPDLQTVRSGAIAKRRKDMYNIFKGCWRSCIEQSDGMGPSPTNRQYLDFGTTLSKTGNSIGKPFIADAIIANPPSFAHVHCAERLGIPLHLMFTMPWSPTRAFPHPLANIQFSNAERSVTNIMTYALIDVLTWQGLGDVINQFRKRCLTLEPLSVLWAPGIATRLRIPFTYCWSPTLIPKPRDWGSHISVAGYFNLPVESSFQPDADLIKFLTTGPQPIYIGFGSIVVDDTEGLTELIFDAIAKAGVRALVSKGWGGFGNNRVQVPDNVRMIDSVPHDWLFKHVAAVVHHGGAGTTAAGIIAGKPTLIVPFFGDQPFWGAMIEKAGAGPAPIPIKQLTSHNLSAAMTAALQSDIVENAKLLQGSLATETGCNSGATSFHANLPLKDMRCSLIPSRTAVWRVKRSDIRLSAFAATVLEKAGLISYADLKLYRSVEYDLEDGPWDPLSGGAVAILGTLGSLMMGFAHLPIEMIRVIKQSRNQEMETSVIDQQALGDSAPEGSSAFQRNSNNSGLKEHIAKDGEQSQTEPSTQKSRKLVNWNPDEELCGSWGTISRRTGQWHGDSKHSHSHLNILRQNSTGMVLGIGKAFAKIASAGLKSPMDFSISLSRGFQNIQKLYGDKTIRHSVRVTDLKSGLAVAGKGFGLGILDAISGVVIQPLHGAQEGGTVGLVKGLGRGLAGIVLKPGAAITGLPAYTLKGMYKELKNYISLDFSRYIIEARKVQGEEELQSLTLEARSEVTRHWQVLMLESKLQEKDI